MIPTDLLDDPSISCVYIALPNSLHFEWALKSLQAGKHVLLEKPSCSNATEARTLFNHPLLHSANAPVLLEAFHYRFHPAWQTFMSLIRDPLAGPVKSAYSCQYLWKGQFPSTDIRFRYSMSGGCLMDFGTYNLSCLRQILGVEPEVVSASYRGMPEDGSGDVEREIDQAIKATYKTPDGARATLVADLATKGGWPSFLPTSWTKDWPSFGWPKCVVELEEKEVEVEAEVSRTAGQSHTLKRNVTLWNHLGPSIYHRIDVLDIHVIRGSDGSVVKTWTDSKQVKAYVWIDREEGHMAGAEWWTTYRHQLEQFVNKVKGRKGSGVWVDGQDSIAQMEAIDRTYEKAGLKPRPTSDFTL